MNHLNLSEAGNIPPNGSLVRVCFGWSKLHHCSINVDLDVFPTAASQRTVLHPGWRRHGPTERGWDRAAEVRAGAAEGETGSHVQTGTLSGNSNLAHLDETDILISGNSHTVCKEQKISYKELCKSFFFPPSKYVLSETNPLRKIMHVDFGFFQWIHTQKRPLQIRRPSLKHRNSLLPAQTGSAQAHILWNLK